MAGVAEVKEWKIDAEGKITGPNGGSLLLDVAKRMLDHRPLKPAMEKIALNPASYRKPERITGGQDMPKPPGKNYDHGKDPGYLKHGKHSKDPGPHIKPSTSKKGKLRILSSRPYLPEITNETVEAVMDLLARYYLDGTTTGA